MYGRCSTKYSIVVKWSAEFKRGRDFLKDGPRPGGPADVINQEMTDRTEAAESKIVSEYDQEIPQSQTADNPVAPRGRAAQPSRDTRKTN